MPQDQLELQSQALRDSEERYRTLFNSIDEGFCIIEVLFDANGAPADYLFIEVNPAFERHTGLPTAQGKRMRDMVPEHDQHWFDIYGRVATTGEAVRFDNEAKALGRWFDVYAFRVGEPAGREVGILFNDVTTRKRAEAVLRDGDRRKDEFLAILAHELRNPLAPIRNGVHLLKAATAHDQDARSVLSMMERQI